MASQLAKILRYNKVKFAKLTDLMEQKFGTAVAISERLIHTAYSNRLSPGALDHEALIAVVKYLNDITKQRHALFCPPTVGPLSHRNLVHLQTR